MENSLAGKYECTWESESVVSLSTESTQYIPYIRYTKSFPNEKFKYLNPVFLGQHNYTIV